MRTFMTWKTIVYHVGVLVTAFIAGGFSGHWFAPPTQVVLAPPESVGAKSPAAGTTATNKHVLALSNPIPTSMYGAVFNPTSSSVCPSGSICEYGDSGLSALRVHNSNNIFTELSPSWIGPFPAGSSIPLATATFEAQTNDFMSIAPNDGRAPWNCFAKSNSNAPDTPDDYIVECGNNACTAGRCDVTKGQMAWTIESICLAGTGCVAPGQMEEYWNFMDHTGANWRVLTINGQEDGTGPRVGLVGTTAGLGSGSSINAATQVLATSTQTLIQSPDTNQQFLTANGASAQVFEGGVQRFFFGVHGEDRNQSQMSLWPGSGDALDLGANLSETTHKLRWREANVAGLIGGCSTAVARPTCDAETQGGIYNICSTGGVEELDRCWTPDNTTFTWKPVGSEWNFSAYTATHASATGVHNQTTTTYANRIKNALFAVDTTGSGGGSMVLKVCDDGATCALGHVYVTCTTLCAATPGTITSCTVSTVDVPVGTTLSWTETTACGTNDLGGNMSAHLANPG